VRDVRTTRRSTVLAGALLVGTLLGGSGCAGPQAGTEIVTPHDARWLVRDVHPAERLPPGIVAPYPVERVIGTFGDCRPGGRQHRGLDLAGVGPNAGLGTPIRAMTRARIVSMHRPEDNPARWGRRDTRGGTVERRGVTLPRQLHVPGYGNVAFFTRDHGSALAGVTIVLEGVGGLLDGHRIRYMHLGELHPGLAAGDVVEAGQEVGVMGSTAILESLPHVHIDIEDPRGDRVDVAPLLGLEADTRVCRR
jgi:murein DD-endopeptidase MepM/ murein hydrolase activator NlpD